MQLNWIVFTDLDGTLLDHDDYSFAAALPALNALKARNIPIILNSSKTLSELANISSALNLNAPVIAENGSIIFDPHTQQTTNLGVEYATICALLDALRNEYQLEFAGFHDWDTQAIMNLTNLDHASANQAKQRQASEPILWQDSADKLEKFTKKLNAHHLKLVRGGRFWHVMGNTDKVIAMQTLQQQYANSSAFPMTSIALGDSPNDHDMLCAADIGIVVKNPYRPEFTPCTKTGQTNSDIIYTQEAGPEGWNSVILSLLDNHRILS